MLDRLKGQLVVSCQAAAGSPLEPVEHIVALARAAILGGARALRLEGIANVAAVRTVTTLPIIGIVKAEMPGTEVFITGTTAHVDALSAAGADIIAFDATSRKRPETVATLAAAAHANGKIAMADISTAAEGEAAVAAGADFAGTTLAGYTTYSPQLDGPDFGLMQSLRDARVPFAAEGRIWSPEEARRALDLGATFVVVGSAITRPDVITRRFADAIAGRAIAEVGEVA